MVKLALNGAHMNRVLPAEELNQNQGAGSSDLTKFVGMLWRCRWKPESGCYSEGVAFLVPPAMPDWLRASL